jgi:hypothetical protein
MSHENAAPSSSEHPYARFLERVEKPSRYVGGEHGEVRKDWDTCLGKLCLAFPDVYDIGMSHLGLQDPLRDLNGHERSLASAAYAPWADMEAELRGPGPAAASLETWRPLPTSTWSASRCSSSSPSPTSSSCSTSVGIPLPHADRSEPTTRWSSSAGRWRPTPSPSRRSRRRRDRRRRGEDCRPWSLAWAALKRRGRRRGVRAAATPSPSSRGSTCPTSTPPSSIPTRA